MSKHRKRQKDKEELKSYRNPAETLWGKILIWAILISMVGAVIIGLVVALLNI